MKRFPLALLFLLIQQASWAAPAPASRPAPLGSGAFSVLAHGDERQFWIGQVNQFQGIPGALNTAIYYRPFGQDNHWQLLSRVQARVVEMSSQGNTAGLLMDDGSWSLLYTDGTLVTAGPLPSPARMVALAGGRTTWWAVGEVLGGIKAIPPSIHAGATTGPSTRRVAATGPAAATSQPQSQPSEVRLVLFKLNGNDWDAVSELPGQLPEVSHLSLELFDDTPYLADLDREGAVQVRHLENGHWTTDLRLDDIRPVSTFKLLAGQPPARLWVDHPTGGDQIFVLAGAKTRSFELTPVADSAPGGRTLALFAGKLRMIARKSETLWEQDYSVDTGAVEGSGEVPLPKPSPLLDLQTFQTIIVIAAFVAILFGWYRRQVQAGEATPQVDLATLAPIGRRFIAGVIDASPVILTVVFTAVRDANTAGMSPQTQELILWLAYWAAGLFYILYTTLVESLAGRSLGKVLMGLRVVDLDGKPATPTALIVRNVLRIFDVGTFFLPVLMIAFSPLRQRPADFAAGTLVVTGDQQPKDQANDEKSEESSESGSAKR